MLAADRLLREGYVAAIRDPMGEPAARTTLIDYTTTSKGSATPHLQELFDLAPEDIISAPDPSAGVRYQLIVGANYQPCPTQ
jgi:hypothetical protein